MQTRQLKLFFFTILLPLQSLQILAQTAHPTVAVCEFDIDAGAGRELFVVDHLSSVDHLAASADGTWLSYDGVLRSATPTEPAERSIFVCRQNGTERRDVGPGSRATWSPNHQRLIFQGNAAEPGIWFVRSDGQDRRLLDTFGSQPLWSPSGATIAYTRDVNDRRHVVLFSLTEDDFRSVFEISAAPNTLVQAAAWSKDSAQLMIVSSAVNAPGRLTSLNVSGEPNVTVLRADLPTDRITINDASEMVFAWKAASQPLQQLFLASGPSAEMKFHLISGQPSDRQNFSPVFVRSTNALLYLSGSL